MIYSKRSGSYIPVTVEKTEHYQPNYGKITRYVVKDGRIPVGRVSLSDTPRGVHVNFMEKFNHNYSHFGEIADQIEVEHCLKRGLTDFEVESDAALNSHALHYLRGKRFFPETLNDIVKEIIENTPKGESYRTGLLGGIRMFMPKALIQKYIERIKIIPLLK